MEHQEPQTTRPNLAVPIVIFALFIVLLGCELMFAVHRDDEPIKHPSTTQHAVATRPAVTTRVAATTKPADPFAVMFDGKTLGNWKSTEFGGEGLVMVEDGKLVVRAGATLSGVTWHGPPPPTVDYEIELDAMKLDGSDFVLALTFPYKKDHASLVLGGWGGSLVGLSSINGNDAANNETMTTREFAKNEWFHVRLRVTDDRIQAWIDKADEPILNLETKDKEISTRSDIDLAKPLGLSTFQTSAAYKNITLKKL